MPVGYAIQAEVIDIRSDTPKTNDIFLVDSCVWLWMAYSNASHDARPYQVNDYPNYIRRVRLADAKLRRCGLSLAELAYKIEKIEWELFKRTKYEIKRKEYRHNDKSRRIGVVNEIQNAWNTVKTLADPIEVVINENATERIVNDLSTYPIDVFDAFMWEAIKNNGLIKIITDDGDFATVPGLQVFTANKTLINSAKTQSKLTVRQ